MTTRVYCYVRFSGARIAGFPDVVDQGEAIDTTRRLRAKLRDVITDHGRNPALHGHLYRLEVRTAEHDLHVCDVEATP